MLKLIICASFFLINTVGFSGDYILSSEMKRKEMCSMHGLDFSEYRKIFPFQNFRTKKTFEVITPLKSGTHLLLKALSLMTGNSSSGELAKYRAGKKIPEKLDVQKLDDYYYSIEHFYYDYNLQRHLQSPYKSISIIRDPRDILISQCFAFVAPHDEEWTNSSIKERARILLENPERHWAASDLRFQLDSSLTLCIEKQNVHIVQFEKLVGAGGGGKDMLQRQELLDIAEFIGITLNEAQLSFLQKNLFGGGFGTFRKGKIGSWKDYFDDQLKDSFKNRYNSYLITFGYENDDQW